MLGLFFNQAYKRAMTARLNGSEPNAAVPSGGRAEFLFTLAMFASMGRVAKLDGRVTQGEVKYATTIMQLMGLEQESRMQAIDYFEQGKQLDTDVLACVRAMIKMIGARSPLADLFLKIQCRMAYIKGDIRLKEKLFLRDAAELMGFSVVEFLDICTQMQSHADYKQLKARSNIHHAYSILQLEPTAADGEIRRAYLRMMSRYHPDKLVRDNLSEETLKQAQEKSTAIRDAYEALCGFRKIRA
ncbi:MAG: co-chaperone DjlA [Pseudohongiellaceae bacterium]